MGFGNQLGKVGNTCNVLNSLVDWNMKRGQFERFVFPPTPDLTAGFFYKKKNSGNTDRIKLAISEKTLFERLDRK